MFTNRPSCTIWEQTVIDRSPAWVRHVTGAVYWQGCDAQRLAGTERRPEDRALCIIHRDSIGLYIPKPDDRILPGTVETDRPPADALTVVTIKDFLFGSDAVQHIEVEAE